MPEPLSPEILARLRARMQPPAPPKAPVSWLQLFFVFLALGAVGWFGWQHWRYRLPAERDLTGPNGQTMHATIQARDNNYLEVLLPGSSQARFLPIASLSADDQDFVRHLATGLTFQFPLDYALTGVGGATTPVRLVSRNTQWVKVTYLADHSSTYLPIAELSPADQAVVNLMPVSLTLLFPLGYTLTGQPDPGAKIHFLGCTNNFTKYQDDSSQATHYIAIAVLSATDQSFLRQITNYMPESYPVDFPLTLSDGQNVPGMIYGYNNQVVALKSSPQNPSRYFLIERLSQQSRNFLHELPGSMTLACPLDAQVMDKQGQAMSLHVLARAQDFLRIAGPNKGVSQYLPLADLSDEDQEVFRLLPISLTLTYPFDYVLTDQTGRALTVQILGRSDSMVRFRTTNGSATDYSLDKLSVSAREFLHLLPVSLPPPVVETPEPESEPAEVTTLRDQIAALQTEEDHLRENVADPTTGPREKAVQKRQIDDNVVKISLLKSKLDLLLKKSTP